jgi:hypothetical protein
VFEKQYVERRVGKHNSQPRLSRGHQGRYLCIFSHGTEQNGSLGRREKLSLSFLKKNQFFRFLKSGCHESKGLVLPSLMMPESFQDRSVSRIAGKMKTSKPFNGGKPSCPQSFYGSFQGRLFHKGEASPMGSVENGTAFPACHGLSVITPVFRIGVFLGTE